MATNSPSSTASKTATKTATATKTSTVANPRGNITVTGGAGKGHTVVTIGGGKKEDTPSLAGLKSSSQKGQSVAQPAAKPAKPDKAFGDAALAPEIDLIKRLVALSTSKRLIKNSGS